MLVYTGDLGMDDGTPQSVYELDKPRTTMVLKRRRRRRSASTCRRAQTVDAARRARARSRSTGSQRWNKIQISQTPGQVGRARGVVLALLGLLGSLFIRPRRVWVRARRDGTAHSSRWPASTGPAVATSPPWWASW